jgi:hypothetical protein
MADEYRVDFPQEDQLADESGDWAPEQDVVTDDSEQLVPRRDLDNVRSIEQRRQHEIRQQYESQLADANLRSERQERQTQLTLAWTQQYITRDGLAPAEAFRVAQTAAAQRVEQEFQQREQQTKLQRYEQQEQVQQTKAERESLRDEVMATVGLTQEQLRIATRGVTPDMPNFRDEVWKRAIAFKTTGGRQAQASSARELRSKVPFIAGSTPVKANYQELPHNVKLGRDSGKSFLEEQKKARRRARQRGR